MSAEFDDDTRQRRYWSYDYLRSATPNRVVRPKNLADLRALLRGLAAHNANNTPKLHASVRASYNSLDGQALNDDVLIDLCARDDDNQLLREYSRIGPIDTDGTIWVGAFATFRPLLQHTVAHGWVPLSMPTGPDITIAGSIAAGGISRFSHVWGTEQAQVLALDVVTGDGVLHENVVRTDPLFRAVVAGHGWVGIILRARLQLRRVCEPGQALFAETKLSKIERKSNQSRSEYYDGLLAALFAAGRDAIEARDAGKALFYDAQSMVGFLDADTMLHYQSRWVTSVSANSRGALDIYSGLTPQRLVGEWAVSVPALRPIAARIYFGRVQSGVYTNDWSPFAFFFEGNVELRRRLNSGVANPVAAELAATDQDLQRGVARLLEASRAFASEVRTAAGVGQLYALQQTHLFETRDASVQFLLSCRARLPTIKRDRPTVVDLLYLPGCADGPYLGTSGEHGGFAITLGWQEILRSPSGMKEEQILAGQLARDAERLGGKVSMLKNLWCDRGLVRRVYGASSVEAFEAVRATHDPQSVLQNEFYQRHLER
jgi:hypothetical protein